MRNRKKYLTIIPNWGVNTSAMEWTALLHNDASCWDDMVFYNSGNRLARVNDYAYNNMGFNDKLQNSPAYYEYSPAGRMTRDNNMNHTIAYNHLGLVKTVTQNGSTLAYTYDGAGRRIKKQLGAQTPRYYMDGIEARGDRSFNPFCVYSLRTS